MALIPIYHPGLDARSECPEESLAVLRRSGWTEDLNPPDLAAEAEPPAPTELDEPAAEPQQKPRRGRAKSQEG